MRIKNCSKTVLTKNEIPVYFVLKNVGTFPMVDIRPTNCSALRKLCRKLEWVWNHSISQQYLWVSFGCPFAKWMPCFMCNTRIVG